MPATKAPLSRFIVTELSVYLSQIVMFFLVAVLSSNLLREEKYLVSFMNSRINENTLFDVIATMIAIAATVGIIAGIRKAVPASSLLEKVADEVLSEAPRTAYVFGSGVAGTILAVALFLRNHPEIDAPTPGHLTFIATLWAFTGFLYGCLFAYAFKYRSMALNGKQRGSDAL